MREVTVLVEDVRAEQLADFLMDCGAVSASLEDADLDTPDEVPLYGEPGMEPSHCAWRRSLVKMLVDDDTNVEPWIERAQSVFGLTLTPVSDVTLPDEDWVRVTQAQFPPTQVSERLWIVPSWHDIPSPEAVNLRLDPGVAFGTGSHPTTHLCLEWLDECMPQSASVMDYGCGTGILAIAAGLLGARRVEGIDIDPQAVESSIWNAEVNGVTGHFHLPDIIDEPGYDVVIANILCGPLEELAPRLTSLVKPNGHLVLSGLLADQAQRIIAFYEKTDPSLRMTLWRQRDEWVALHGQRQG